MPVRRILQSLVLLGALVTVRGAWAADGCAFTSTSATDTASRIAAVACAEHALWYRPFIDDHGRLASTRVSEAEGARLADGTSVAWRRVASYWQESGVRWPASGFPAGADCAAGTDNPAGGALCRTFLIDTPWSAVFVSYVMRRAGVPGFQSSARHVDYVRDAYRNGTTGPYRLADPDAEVPAVGDLLCFARMPSQVFGHAGFKQWLDRPFSDALAMHCDIVVSVMPGQARTIGGNVLQGVTMRMFALNHAGRFWSLPRRSGGDAECGPDNANACNLDRQDWVALLKLNPSANVPLALPASTPPPAGACCEVCSLPMPPGMQRCPVAPPSGGSP